MVHTVQICFLEGKRDTAFVEYFLPSVVLIYAFSAESKLRGIDSGTQSGDTLSFYERSEAIVNQTKIGTVPKARLENII